MDRLFTLGQCEQPHVSNGCSLRQLGELQYPVSLPHWPQYSRAQKAPSSITDWPPKGSFSPRSSHPESQLADI